MCIRDRHNTDTKVIDDGVTPRCLDPPISLATWVILYIYLLICGYSLSWYSNNKSQTKTIGNWKDLKGNHKKNVLPERNAIKIQKSNESETRPLLRDGNT